MALSLRRFHFSKAKADAIAEIETERQGIQNEFINQWIEAAIYDINQQGTDTKEKIDNIKLKILDLIKAFQDGKAEGYAEGLEEGKAVGRAEAFGEMGTPCDDCPAVEVSKGTTTIKLYNPDKVEFKKE